MRWSPSAAARIRWYRSKPCARMGIAQTVTWIGSSPLIQACAERTGLPLLNITPPAGAAELFEMNKQGALNGHIPVTAVNSAILALAALLHNDADQVVFSNERSASYGSLIPGTGEVNHQWSKGWDFERAFRRHAVAKNHMSPRTCTTTRCCGRSRSWRWRGSSRGNRSLRRAFLQLQPQFPHPRRAPRAALVRRLPEMPFRVPGPGAVHAEAAPDGHLRPQPA